jgi:hypothetical protein
MKHRQRFIALHVTADASAAKPVPQHLLLWLTIGVAGTVLFSILHLLEGETRPGHPGV